jgi:hypothetical protein
VSRARAPGAGGLRQTEGGDGIERSADEPFLLGGGSCRNFNRKLRVN